MIYVKPGLKVSYTMVIRYICMYCRVVNSFNWILIIKKTYLLIAILPVILFQAGCDSNDIDPDPERLGLEFYPLETGLYRDYKIRHIRYSAISKPDTSNYYLREHVLDSVVNMEGGYTYILARYSKDSLNLDWELDSLWKAEKNSKFVRITENNVPYVKLVFPVKEGMSWDGNAYNNEEPKEYAMGHAYQPFQVLDSMYEESVTIMHDSIPDQIVRYILKYEVYGNNVGLIFMEDQDLNYCTWDYCRGQGIIDEGFFYRQELIGYGKD